MAHVHAYKNIHAFSKEHIQRELKVYMELLIYQMLICNLFKVSTHWHGGNMASLVRGQYQIPRYKLRCETLKYQETYIKQL